jgi:hypothetical protein
MRIVFGSHATVVYSSGKVEIGIAEKRKETILIMKIAHSGQESKR